MVQREKYHHIVMMWEMDFMIQEAASSSTMICCFCETLVCRLFDENSKKPISVDENEHTWITENCRKAWDEFVGGEYDPCKDALNKPITPENE